VWREREEGRKREGEREGKRERKREREIGKGIGSLAHILQASYLQGRPARSNSIRVDVTAWKWNSFLWGGSSISPLKTFN
jgi:hypothetical protein